jgi:ABC-type Fe3+/spermidine/putrescine transport system ATPase subunit
MELQNFYRGDILFVTHDLTQGYKLSSRLAVYESGRIIQCDNKRRVINCPVNRTVARLTGLKNLMDGRITSIEGKVIRVEVPNLSANLKVHIEDNANLSVDQQVTVGIRPENIVIAGEPSENTVSGKITQVIEGVTSVNFYFSADGRKTSEYDIEATLPRSRAAELAPDKTCYLHLPHDHLIIIAD